MKLSKSKIIVICLMVFNLYCIFTSSAQCAMCKANVESNMQNGGTTGSSINTAILYLMAIPYVLLLGTGYYFFRKSINSKVQGLYNKLRKVSA